MGRPSVRDERREEILDALQDCVRTYGLAETTLARVAERAGMQPSAINHFIGTRDAVIEAALARSTGYYEALIDSLTDKPLSDVLDVLIDASAQPRIEADAMVIFDEMLTLAPRDVQVRERVEHALSSLRRLLQTRLDLEHPDADAADRRAVALTIMLIIDNLERHTVLGIIPEGDRASARRAIDALLGTLHR